MIADVTMWPGGLLDTAGRAVSLPWEKLFAQFERAVMFGGDREHPGWSAATFSPCSRAIENVRSVSAMVLDYDGTQGIEGAAELWSSFYGLIHTTRKHTPDVHRFRVILPFARAVTPAEYPGIWRRIFARSGSKLDPAPKDPSRFWFTPGTPYPDDYRTLRLGGQPLDPDALLLEPDPASAPAQAYRHPADNAERRASAYLAKMPEAIAGQAGHQALWAATLAVVQGFGLGEAAAYSLLSSEYNPRCRPAWSERELRHKIRDAANRAKVPAGYKLDDGRDWKGPARTQQAPAKRLEPAATPIDPAEEWDRLGEPAEEAPDALPETTAVQRHGVRSIAEMLSKVYSKASSPKPERGVPSGVEMVDALTGGFRRGNVTVFGAGTSWGKSSFGIMVSDVGARAGKRVLLVSGEDTEETYGRRIMARRAGVNALALRDCSLQARDLDRMAAALGSAESLPYFINGIGKNAEYVARVISDVVAETAADLVIVDYVQAFGCSKKTQDRRNEVTHIARTLVDAIKASGAAGLVFSQLKRLEDGSRPTMHDLKESGDLENMAEHVLIGYSAAPKGEEQRRRYLLLEKNKDGPKLDGPLEMPFDAVTASFREQRAGQTWDARQGVE